MTLQRGRVYLVDLGEGVGPKYLLVVSNNRRNRQLGDALAVRLTTTAKPTMPSVVELPAGEPFVGRVLCDRITVICPDEVKEDSGAVSVPTMRLVETGLMAALGIGQSVPRQDPR